VRKQYNAVFKRFADEIDQFEEIPQKDQLKRFKDYFFQELYLEDEDLRFAHLLEFLHAGIESDDPAEQAAFFERHSSGQSVMSRAIRNLLSVVATVPSVLTGDEPEFVNYNGINILTYEIMVQALGRDTRIESAASPNGEDYRMVRTTFNRAGAWKMLRMSYIWLVALLWPHDNPSFSRWKRMWANPSSAFGTDLYRQPVHEEQLELVTHQDYVLNSIQAWVTGYLAAMMCDRLLRRDGYTSYLPAGYTDNVQPARERYVLSDDEKRARDNILLYAPMQLQILIAEFSLKKASNDSSTASETRKFEWRDDLGESAWMQELTPVLQKALTRLRELPHLNLFIGVGIEIHGQSNALPKHWEKSVPVLMRNDILQSHDFATEPVKAAIVSEFANYFASARATEFGLEGNARGSDQVEEGEYNVFIKRCVVLMIADTLDSVGGRAAHQKLQEYRHTVFLGLKKPLQEMRMLNALYNDTYMPVQTRRWYHPRYMQVMEQCSRHYIEYSCATLTFLAIVTEAYGVKAALMMAHQARKI